MLDAKELGRRIKAARVLAGYERMADLVLDIRQQTDFHISERTLYACERGEQLPSLELYIALQIILAPPSGPIFFAGALPENLQQAFIRSVRS